VALSLEINGRSMPFTSEEGGHDIDVMVGMYGRGGGG